MSVADQRAFSFLTLTTGIKFVALVFSYWVHQTRGNLSGGRLSVMPQRAATAASQMNSSLQIISSVDTRPVAFQLKSWRLSSTPSSEREATGRALSRKGAATKRLKTLQSKPRRTFLGAVRGCRPLGQGPLVLSISNALYATGFLPALAALREQYPR